MRGASRTSDYFGAKKDLSHCYFVMIGAGSAMGPFAKVRLARLEMSPPPPSRHTNPHQPPSLAKVRAPGRLIGSFISLY